MALETRLSIGTPVGVAVVAITKSTAAWMPR